MSQANKRKRRAMSMSSRSRSTTPVLEAEESSRKNAAAHSRRRLIMNKAMDSNAEPFLEPEPKIWKPPLKAYAVERTPGGSVHIYDDAPVALICTPHGSLRRKKELEQSIHVATLERAADIGLDEEEADGVLNEHLGHVQQWLSDTLVETPKSTPLCSKPMLGKDVAEEPVPSTSGMVARLTTQRNTRDGSEFDSDFDDKFNLEEFAAFAGQSRDIPDEQELDDQHREIVNSVSQAIDESVEVLVDVDTNFQWQADFASFVAVPEVFSGPTPGPISEYNTPYEAFTNIWDRGIMEHICRETNKYAQVEIERVREAGNLKSTSRLSKWTDTCVNEMYLFFSVLLLMGLDPRTSQHEYWKTSGYLQMPMFRRLMTYNRFILLNKFIHFVDNSDPHQSLRPSGRVISAKLKKIAPVIDHLNIKFTSMYNLLPDIAIDESLTLFKGRLSWVQAIRTKAARFGIKSYELCESRTGYLYKFEIYTGKNTERGDVTALCIELAGKSTQVVLDLLKGLEHRGHCVTMDNFYNCPALARYLKCSGFDCLGTLRPNRKHVPVELAKAPKNVAKGTLIARHCGDVSCIAWKDSKLVYTISTFHNNDTYVGRKAGKELVKPIVVRDYNNTMGGVDLKDQKLAMYLVERKRCVKWYMKIFKRLLNISVLNAFILLTGSLKRRGMPTLTHREFREQLANDLVKQFHCAEQPIGEFVSELTRLQRNLMHVPKNSANKKRSACHICYRKGTVKKVSTKCDTCNEFLCLDQCWREFHSLQVLPGKDVIIRSNRRRET